MAASKAERWAVLMVLRTAGTMVDHLAGSWAFLRAAQKADRMVARTAQQRVDKRAASKAACWVGSKEPQKVGCLEMMLVAVMVVRLVAHLAFHSVALTDVRMVAPMAAGSVEELVDSKESMWAVYWVDH